MEPQDYADTAEKIEKLAAKFRHMSAEEQESFFKDMGVDTKNEPLRAGASLDYTMYIYFLVCLTVVTTLLGMFQFY